MRTSPPYSHSMVSDSRKPAWMLALWGWDIVLYRHFYRRKTSAFAGAGDGLDLRDGYSSTSIVNDRRGLQQHSARLWPPFSELLDAVLTRPADRRINPRAETPQPSAPAAKRGDSNESPHQASGSPTCRTWGFAAGSPSCLRTRSLMKSSLIRVNSVACVVVATTL
jgi:hypothetical protein